MTDPAPMNAPEDIPAPPFGYDYAQGPLVGGSTKSPEFGGFLDEDCLSLECGIWTNGGSGTLDGYPYAIRRGTELHRLNFGAPAPEFRYFKDDDGTRWKIPTSGIGGFRSERGDEWTPVAVPVSLSTFMNCWTYQECGTIETDAPPAPLEAVPPANLPALPEPPAGHRWAYRGMGWEAVDATFIYWPNTSTAKRDKWFQSPTRIAVGDASRHYFEAVPLEREPNHSPASAIRHALQGGLEPVSDAGSADAGEPPRAEGGDTPRTDAAHAEIHREFPEHASDSYWIDFARQLERESAELRAALAAQQHVEDCFNAFCRVLNMRELKAENREEWWRLRSEADLAMTEAKKKADELRQTALAGTQG